MGVLEQVIQMREQGMPDQDIVSQLQEQGIHPRSISDALNQANIKSAVGGGANEDMEQMQYAAEDIPTPEGLPKYPTGNQEYAEDIYVPQVQTQPKQYSYQGSDSQAYNYPQEGGEQYYSGTDADTMVEIAQQVFIEKIKKIQHQLDSLNEFRAIYQTRVDGIYERLKRIESVMDRLQTAILEKVGSYGAGIESVKKELSMVQDSYAKIAGVVSEKHHHPQQHQSVQQHTTPSRQTHHTKTHSAKKHSRKKK